MLTPETYQQIIETVLLCMSQHTEVEWSGNNKLRVRLWRCECNKYCEHGWLCERLALTLETVGNRARRDWNDRQRSDAIEFLRQL